MYPNQNNTQQMSSMNKTSSNAPETKFKAGAISATIWKNVQHNNKQDLFSFFSVNVERNYKDKSGAWKKTNSLRLNDLPKAALVLNKAYEYLAMNAPEDLNN